MSSYNRMFTMSMSRTIDTQLPPQSHRYIITFFKTFTNWDLKIKLKKISKTKRKITSRRNFFGIQISYCKKYIFNACFQMDFVSFQWESYTTIQCTQISASVNVGSILRVMTARMRRLSGQTMNNYCILQHNKINQWLNSSFGLTLKSR